jgi:hypothetical protein
MSPARRDGRVAGGHGTDDRAPHRRRACGSSAGFCRPWSAGFTLTPGATIRSIWVEHVLRELDVGGGQGAPSSPAQRRPASAGERLADDLLRLAARVDIGGVDEVDPGVQGTVDGPYRFVVIGLAQATNIIAPTQTGLTTRRCGQGRGAPWASRSVGGRDTDPNARLDSYLVPERSVTSRGSRHPPPRVPTPRWR